MKQLIIERLCPIHFQMKLVKELESFFENGMVSVVSQYPHEGTKYKYTNNELLEEDREFFDTLPLELRVLYSRVGSNCVYTYNNSYTFLTLNKMKESKKRYTHFIDIAIAYRGMGWFDVISYHPKQNVYFLRCDGGSSGYDREVNYNKYKDYIPEESEFQTLQDIIESSSREYMVE